MRRLASACLLCLLCLPAPSPAGFEYVLTDLGTLGGQQSVAFAVNNSGQVVGYAQDGGLTPRAFLSNGTGPMTDLGVSPAGKPSYAYGINDAGHVVGQSYAPGSNYATAYLYDGSTRIDLGSLNGTGSAAYGVNSSDQVVGASAFSDTVRQRAFLYSNNTMTDLGTFGGSESVAFGINDAGKVAGYAQEANGNIHAFLYDGTKKIDLGTLGGAQSLAYAINNAGQVVGYSETVAGGQMAFLYSNGKMIGLGYLGSQTSYSYSTAYAINNAGQIVGSARLSDGSAIHAFLYQGGSMVDLNSLIPADSGWELTEAKGINDQGQIVGYGLYDGQYPRAFLLTPVPAPPGLVLSSVGVLCLAVYGWRRSRPAAQG